MMVISIVAIRNNARVIALNEAILNKYFQMTKITHELTYRILHRQSGLQQFLLTGKSRYLVAYDENILPVKALIRRAREFHPIEEKYSLLLNQYEELVKQWEENIAETQKEKRQQYDYGLIDIHTYTTSIAEIDKQGRFILRKLNTIEAELLNTVEKDMFLQANLAKKVGQSTKRLLLVIALVGILVTTIFSLLLSRRITSALGKIVRAACTISAGNLSYRIPTLSTEDELKVLANSFNNMTAKLDENLKALRESEKKYSTVVENASDGIGIIQNQRFLFVNRRFSEMMGYDDPDELIGVELFVIIGEDNKQSVIETCARRLRGERVPDVTEVQFVCKNGNIKYFDVSAALIDYRNERSILAIFRDASERKEYEKNLRGLSNQLLATQEEERKRISRELHDEIGQTLAAMNINIEILAGRMELPGNERQQRMEDLRKLITKSIDDIHRISYNLRPYLLDSFGLISALRWYSQTFQERSGIKINLHIEGKWQGIDPLLETTIYRVIQEALTNVSKHAGAKNVFILLERFSDMIKISIHDDGKGFDAEQCHDRNFGEGGLGIFGMRERLSAVRGTFSIESTPGNGTKLLLEIPLQTTEKRAI